jgi:hypothetical protein
VADFVEFEFEGFVLLILTIARFTMACDLCHQLCTEVRQKSGQTVRVVATGHRPGANSDHEPAASKGTGILGCRGGREAMRSLTSEHCQGI